MSGGHSSADELIHKAYELSFGATEAVGEAIKAVRYESGDELRAQALCRACANLFKGRTALMEHIEVRTSKYSLMDDASYDRHLGYFRLSASKGCEFVEDTARCKCGGDVFERPVVICARTHRMIGFHPVYLEIIGRI